MLFYDVATQNTSNMFVSVSGRAYENNRKGGPGLTLGGRPAIFGATENKSERLYGMMTTKPLPPVLLKLQRFINVVITINGLDLSELGIFWYDNEA